MHASLLGFCLESLILDNDLLGQAMRGVRGIEVTEDSLSLEVIREVCCNGPGHYLGQPHTLRLMQRELSIRRWETGPAPRNGSRWASRTRSAGQRKPETGFLRPTGPGCSTATLTAVCGRTVTS